MALEDTHTVLVGVHAYSLTMAFYVYILHSQSLGKYYTGFSKFRFKRLRQHRRGRSHWTSRATDWRQVFCKTISDRAEAASLEKGIKKRGAERFLTEDGKSS